jgi:GntR family transcriptional regulator/MocR family aminotransferase
MVLPSGLVDDVRREKLLHDQGTARIEQLAFARFLERGDLDRHLRKMRARYRTRRDVMVEALARFLPEATVRGIAAGLHVTVELPPGADEAAVAATARSRGIALATMADYWSGGGYPPTLILGYSQMTESRLRAGVSELAGVVRAGPTSRALPAAVHGPSGTGA